MDFVHSPGISRASGNSTGNSPGNSTGNSTGTREKRILSCCWQWRRGGAGTRTSRELGGMSSETVARKALMGSFQGSIRRTSRTSAAPRELSGAEWDAASCVSRPALMLERPHAVNREDPPAAPRAWRRRRQQGCITLLPGRGRVQAGR